MIATSELNFGRIEITERLLSLLNIMNGHIWSLCAELPRPIRDSAVLWLQKHYAGFHPQDARTFLLRFFHPPAWTIIEHLQCRNRIPAHELEILLKAQASAMLVHMIDDHIVDGQVSADHLALHLRTTYWTYFTETLEDYQSAHRPTNRIVEECVETYLAGVHNTKTHVHGEQYRAEFLKQASTWMIAPLLAGAAEERELIQTMYENFALAWRLLDDLRDAPGDAAQGARTSVYFALDAQGREYWNRQGESRSKASEIMQFVNENGTARFILTEIKDRLALAAGAARDLNLPGLALEYEALARLRNGPADKE